MSGRIRIVLMCCRMRDVSHKNVKPGDELLYSESTPVEKLELYQAQVSTA